VINYKFKWTIGAPYLVVIMALLSRILNGVERLTRLVSSFEVNYSGGVQSLAVLFIKQALLVTLIFLGSSGPDFRLWDQIQLLINCRGLNQIISRLKGVEVCRFNAV